MSTSWKVKCTHCNRLENQMHHTPVRIEELKPFMFAHSSSCDNPTFEIWNEYNRNRGEVCDLGYEHPRKEGEEE